MSLIKEVLDGSQFNIVQIKVLDGSDEAFNSWNAANFMKVPYHFFFEFSGSVYSIGGV